MADTPTKRTDKRTETHECDYISRQAAIDRINKQREHLEPNIFPQDKIGDAAYRICAEFIERLPSAQQWITVSSGKLPKVRQRVLCQCRAGIQEVLQLTDDGDWECIYPHTIYMKSFVVAWVPLPEPFREGGAEECH